MSLSWGKTKEAATMLENCNSLTGVIYHSGSLPEGATPFSDFILRWKSAFIKQ